MKPELDDLGKLLQKSFGEQPEVLEKILNLTEGSHFDEEYPTENPSILENVKEHLTPESTQMFVIYNRLLKAYGGNNDGQFLIDFFAYGAATYPFLLKNKNKILDSLLIRGSQIRLLIDSTEGLTIDNFLEVYQQVLEGWALSDVMEIEYQSFLPVKISKILAKVQLGVINSG